MHRVWLTRLGVAVWREGESHEEEPQEGKKVGEATELDGAKLKQGGEGWVSDHIDCKMEGKDHGYLVAQCQVYREYLFNAFFIYNKNKMTWFLRGIKL